jgi:hypothetical protein
VISITCEVIYQGLSIVLVEKSLGSKLHSSESVEHKKAKALISDRLKEWTGATLQEYPSSGHELDVFAITPDGISIYVEIIWSDSLQNFYRDLNMIQVSDANLKLVVVNPRMISNEKCQREFEKVAISQRKLGFAMHGDLIDGDRIIKDQVYLVTEFRQIVFDLLAHVQRYGKVVGKQSEFEPPKPKSVDRVEECLLSNLFPVTKFPSTIFSAPTEVRRVADVFMRLGREVGDHPFLLKSRRLYTFENLRDSSSIFGSVIQNKQITEEESLEWLRNDVKRNDIVYLFNIALEKYCRKRGMYFDREHDRFVCLLDDGKDKVFEWRAKTKRVERRVARKVFGKDGKLLFCIHYASSLRFIVIDNVLFLKIEPTRIFTSNGFTPIRVERLASLMSRYLSKEYNSAYLSLVRFWAKYLSRLDVKIVVPAGNQAI